MNDDMKISGASDSDKTDFAVDAVFARPDGLGLAFVLAYSDGSCWCDIVSLIAPMFPIGSAEVSAQELRSYPNLGSRAEVAAMVETMSRAGKIAARVKARLFTLKWRRMVGFVQPAPFAIQLKP